MEFTEFEKYLIRQGLELVREQANKEIQATEGRSFVTIEFVDQSIKEIKTKLELEEKPKSNDYHENN